MFFFQHKLGFVHRDIKAENVLLVTEDRIKLADFGFSTQLVNGPQQHLDTFCGSPPYAAPELFSDDHYVGSFVDVWALGVLLYFMVIGNMPFRAPTVPALRSAVLKGDFSLPAVLSLPCLRLIRKLPLNRQHIGGDSILIFFSLCQNAFWCIRLHVYRPSSNSCRASGSITRTFSWKVPW